MLAEKLERKVKGIAESLDKNKNNWEQTYYQYLAKNFGLSEC